MLITRRTFLKSSAVMAAGAALMPVFLRRAVAATLREAGSTGNRTLVLVQLAGGNDGLNTVVPYADGRYYDLRPGLALAQGDVLPLNAEIGLHPALARFKELWNQGVLAVVEGVGYQGQSFSHFESMHFWQTADPGGRAGNGWLGRYFEELAQSEDRLFPGLAVGRRLPPELFSASEPIPIVESVEGYRFRSDPRYPLDASAPRGAPYALLLDTTIASASSSSAALRDAQAAYAPKAAYPETRLGAALKLVAEAITADLGLKVGHVTIGGFDTHAAQEDAHAGLLTTVAEAVHAFYMDMQGHERGKDVVIMTWSEFGRRVSTNASARTDHGSAAPLFVIGERVKGGLYGERPDLGQLDRNNLRHTVDYRSVYSTVLEQWLGAPSESILGARFEQLAGLFAA